MSEHEQRAAIADVLLRYAVGIDRRDWDLFRTCFTDDCELDYGDIGSWQGAAVFTEAFESMHAPLGHTMHNLGNLDIRLDRDGARARTYVNALIMTKDGQSGFAAHGYYDDQLVQVGGSWQIAHRRFIQVHVSTVGADPGRTGVGS
ncbi:nuclear transport factor 2 family protein [Frankia sp. R82]|uniref:nuclear transport factor 2 family protein n=1 Tax=Frankia sp. R82 TaxID=2950553 RepID=UPI002042F8A4|nr:nuclear transport factor 2 family protein [Frankia sp. R82]MCM3883380.1 nuclear transport factor 2 family protein [Frankia sp. R82]